MTPYRLLEELGRELKAAVSKYRYPAEEGSKPVTIYLQSIPEEEFATDSFYPLLLLEVTETSDDAEESKVQVLITVGTYNGEKHGWQLHLNLVEEIRQYLLSHVLIDAFGLDKPLIWSPVERVLDNFTFSMFVATYRMPGVMPEYLNGGLIK